MTTITINDNEKLNIFELVLKLRGFTYNKQGNDLTIDVDEKILHQLYKAVKFYQDNNAARDWLIKEYETKTSSLTLDEIIYHYNLGYYIGRVVELLFNYKQNGGLNDLETIKKLLEKHIKTNNLEQGNVDRNFLSKSEVSNKVFTEYLREYRFELYDIAVPDRKLLSRLNEAEYRCLEFLIQANNAIKPVARIQACRNVISIIGVLKQEFEKEINNERNQFI